MILQFDNPRGGEELYRFDPKIVQNRNKFNYIITFGRILLTLLNT